MDTEQAIRQLREVVAQHHELRLVLLYGSRARGDEHARSDWDLGFLAEGDLDYWTLLSEVTQTLGTDKVDLVDLTRASGLLRFRAVSEGIIVFEAAPDIYHDFAVSVALYWYDVEPIVRQAHNDFFARLR